MKNNIFEALKIKRYVSPPFNGLTKPLREDFRMLRRVIKGEFKKCETTISNLNKKNPHLANEGMLNQL